MNEEKRKVISAPEHDCTIKARTHTDITGVNEVVSFDDERIVLVTKCGEMTFEGQGLRIGSLDIQLGIVSVDGQISAVLYSDVGARKRRGFRSRSND